MGKHFSLFFVTGFSLFSRNNVSKKHCFLAAFFAILLLREKQKKRFVSPTFFACYFLKIKRKPVETKKCTEMFSYHFLAHIPKIT